MARPTNSEEYREAQLVFIEMEFSNLVENDLGYREKFLKLACETSDALPDNNWHKYFCYRPYASSAANLACGEINKTRQLLPISLQKKWLAWRQDYEQLIKKNPRLDLRDRMQDMSEYNDSTSWPSGYEDNIQDWVDHGDIKKPPFDAPSDFPSPEYYEHLKELRSRIQGWLYWSYEHKRVVYAPEPQWLEIKERMRVKKFKDKEIAEKFRAMMNGAHDKE